MTVDLLLVDADRVAIVRRLDADVDVAGGVGQVTVTLTATGVSVERYRQAAPPAGVLQGLGEELANTILVEGDRIRMSVSAGTTVAWWLSYVLLEGDPT